MCIFQVQPKLHVLPTSHCASTQCPTPGEKVTNQTFKDSGVTWPKIDPRSTANNPVVEKLVFVSLSFQIPWPLKSLLLTLHFTCAFSVRLFTLCNGSCKFFYWHIYIGFRFWCIQYFLWWVKSCLSVNHFWTVIHVYADVKICCFFVSSFIKWFCLNVVKSPQLKIK